MWGNDHIVIIMLLLIIFNRIGCLIVVKTIIKLLYKRTII